MALVRHRCAHGGLRTAHLLLWLSGAVLGLDLVMLTLLVGIAWWRSACLGLAFWVIWGEDSHFYVA